jgi:antitoxin component of MazEF toxin-antitoxin module
MTHVIVGKRGKDLAIRVPFEVARACGLSDGEVVEIKTFYGDILIRRSKVQADDRREAEIAASEIVADSKKHSLRGISIRELGDEGHKG